MLPRPVNHQHDHRHNDTPKTSGAYVCDLLSGCLRLLPSAVLRGIARTVSSVVVYVLECSARCCCLPRRDRQLQGCPTMKLPPATYTMRNFRTWWLHSIVHPPG